MLLSQKEIKAQLASLSEEATEAHVKEVCYDLCVGDEVYRSEQHLPERLSDGSPYMILHRDQFEMVKTLEVVKVPPEMVGLITIRSEFKSQGTFTTSSVFTS